MQAPLTPGWRRARGCPRPRPTPPGASRSARRCAAPPRCGAPPRPGATSLGPPRSRRRSAARRSRSRSGRRPRPSGGRWRPGRPRTPAPGRRGRVPAVVVDHLEPLEERLPEHLSELLVGAAAGGSRSHEHRHVLVAHAGELGEDRLDHRQVRLRPGVVADRDRHPVPRPPALPQRRPRPRVVATPRASAAPGPGQRRSPAGGSRPSPQQAARPEVSRGRKEALRARVTASGILTSSPIHCASRWWKCRIFISW